MENIGQLRKHWNQILAKEKLSIWAGREHKELWLPYVIEEGAPRIRNSHRDRMLLYRMAFDQLRAEDKNLLQLSRQMKAAEIAEVLKLKSQAAVWKRLQRIRQWIEGEVESLSSIY